MLDMILHAARVSMWSGFMWRHTEPLVVTLLDEGNPIPLKRAMILALPHVPWWQFTNGVHLIQLWVTAVPAIPYAEDIGQSVVDTLLQIAFSDTLSPHVPADMWSWLNKRPSLHPVCWGRYQGTSRSVVRRIRRLGDIEILKSYFLLVWSEWDDLRSGGFSEMYTSIWEYFSGAWMGDHRQDLLRHLDRVLGQLDLGLEHLRQHKLSLDEDIIQQMKSEYGELKKILLKVGE